MSSSSAGFLRPIGRRVAGLARRRSSSERVGRWVDTPSGGDWDFVRGAPNLWRQQPVALEKDGLYSPVAGGPSLSDSMFCASVG